MGRLGELLEKRTKVAGWYLDRLKGLSYVEPITIAPTTDRMSWFVFVVRLEQGLNREEMAAELETRGIPTRPYFIPIHTQPYFVERFGYMNGDFPVTEDQGTRCLALPFSGVMTEDQVEYVVTQMTEVVNFLS